MNLAAPRTLDTLGQPDAPAALAPSAALDTPDTPDGHARGHHVFELPRLTAMLRHALPRFVEGIVAPVAVFYAGLILLGLNGALIAAVAWVYTGVLWRVLRGHQVSGMLLLAALGVTVRAALTAATGSAVVYFLQPTLGTLLVSMTFLASVPLRRPLAQKLATDMVPIPAVLLGHVRVRRFFLRISLLWSLVFLINSAISLWMLFHEPLGTYLWLRTSLVTVLSGAAMAVSVLGFRQCLRRVGADPAGAAGNTSVSAL